MAPFGVYKDSGLGREHGQDAIKEFLRVKRAWINGVLLVEIHLSYDKFDEKKICFLM
jgi:hypothetical protein